MAKRGANLNSSTFKAKDVQRWSSNRGRRRVNNPLRENSVVGLKRLGTVTQIKRLKK